MDVYRNVTTHREVNEHSPSQPLVRSPAITPSDAQPESKAAFSGGDRVSVPSVDPQHSTNGTKPSALELQVQQLCEIFPEESRSEIEAMLVRYNSNTEWIAHVLASRGADGEPGAAGTQHYCPHCTTVCKCCGRQKPKVTQRGQAYDKATTQSMSPQGQSSGVQRPHTSWSDEQGEVPPAGSAVPYTSQRTSSERNSLGENGCCGVTA